MGKHYAKARWEGTLKEGKGILNMDSLAIIMKTPVLHLKVITLGGMA